MTNSDYLIKATVKKLSEKLNKTFLEKIEEAANAAQGAPEIFKKEFENLKDEIINEAKIMEENDHIRANTEKEYTPHEEAIQKSQIKIEKIKNQLITLNNLLDK
tara:strand:+ start:1521 stop:1832 length:312 start_codon:yes stop_codon:yes gene_type:complete